MLKGNKVITKDWFTSTGVIFLTQRQSKSKNRSVMKVNGNKGLPRFGVAVSTALLTDPDPFLVSAPNTGKNRANRVLREYAMSTNEEIFSVNNVEIICKMYKMFGDPAKVRQWLHEEHPAIHYHTPSRLMLTGRSDKVLAIVKGNLSGE